MASQKPSLQQPRPNSGFAVDWPSCPIETLCLRVTSGGTPSRKKSNFFDGTIPWFKTKELTGWYLSDSEEHIGELGLSSSSAKVLPTNTVLMAMYGDGRTITSLGILRRPGTCNQACCALIHDPQKCDYRYLYYALLFHRDDFLRLASGGAQRNLSGATIRNFIIKVPSLREQAAIGEFLGIFDEKIELNRHMNETLEATARACFESWMRSAPSLLPGWNLGTLGNVAENQRRTLNSSTIPPSTPYIGLEHMPRRSIALHSWDSSHSIQSSKFAFRTKEILFGKLRPYFHKVGIAPLDGVCSTDILVISPRRNSYWGLVAFTVSSDAFVNYANRGSTGTKMPRTNWTDMSRFELAVPPEEEALAFNQTVEPIIDRIIANVFEARTLTTTRDTLLPKLLSGEIRVRQAELIAENVL